MKSNSDIIKRIQEEHNNAKHLLLISVVIAVGTSLLASGLMTAYGLYEHPILIILIGALLSIGVIIALFIANIKRVNKKVLFSGAYIVNSDDFSIIPIDRYQISEDMSQYLLAASKENKAIENKWRSEQEALLKERKTPLVEDKLLIELIEYCIIEKMSSHLSEYFNIPDSEKQVQTLCRNDIPEVLLNNRFLRLFSEDMDNREIFQQSLSNDDKRNQTVITAINETNDEEKVIMVFDDSGAIFKDFDLTLPLNSKVKRIDYNTIEINTNVLTITILCSFEGFSTSFPKMFHEFYLGFDNKIPFTSHTYKFDVSISIKFKYCSLFLSDKWKYYLWADDFINKLDSYVDKKRFLESINWNTAYTTIKCVNGLDQYRNRMRKEKKRLDEKNKERLTEEALSSNMPANEE